MTQEEEQAARPTRPRRHAMPLRLDPSVYQAVATWAEDELRSVNAQIETILRRALIESGRMPKQARPIARRGRPRTDDPEQN